jgi:hypothetical protein
VVLSAEDSTKLSGYLVITEAGALDLLWKQRPEAAVEHDRGPSTGLIYKDVHIENVNPVRNFMRKSCCCEKTCLRCRCVNIANWCGSFFDYASRLSRKNPRY